METSTAAASSLVLPTPQSLKVKGTKIKKLVLDGFKSFGKRTELFFCDDFNAVVGANGSGKSNILDAICFVLGKSSSKSLRAEKTAHLIYNGGKTKNPAKIAEVSIVFDNAQKVFPVDDDEVKVTRLVREDGLSKYKLNGKTHTRQEILDVLSSAKINPDGYNIILQGDIVSIVEMSSVDRRKLIEEIAGISVYEEKKQQALNELAKVDQKLGEAEIIMKERQGHLRELKHDRDHALKYKEMNDRVREYKASWLKVQIDKKEQELGKIVERHGECQKKLDETRVKAGEHKTVIAGLKEKVAGISQEIEKNSEVEQVKIQKEIEQLKIDVATDKTRMSSCHNEIARIGQRREQVKNGVSVAEQKILELSEQYGVLKRDWGKMSETVSELDKKIVSFKADHHLEDSLFEKSIEDFDKVAEDKQKALQVIREEQQNLVREKDRVEFSLQVIDEKISKILAIEQEHASDLKVLKQKKEEFKKTVFELNEVLNADSRMAGELAGIKLNHGALSEQVAKLEVKNVGIQENIAGNTAIQKILENRKLFGGIYGTVAELGQVSSKYSLALEIAASQKIHSIVVEDDTVAASCIRFLKEGRFGVATFLPLNKIKSSSMVDERAGLGKERGVHGFAIELISFDSKFKSVFKYVFGSTLVVNDIETARKIGVGKIKMVTLDGDLSELSGAMIGGFRHKKSGSFKEKEVQSELNDAQERLVLSEARMVNLEQKRKENEECICRLRELKMTLEGEIIRTEKSLHLDSGDLDATKSYKDELFAKNGEIGKKIRDVEERADIATQDLTSIKIKKQELRNKMSELRNPAVLAELNAFEQTRKEVGDALIKNEGDQKAVSIHVSGIEREKENVRVILKELEKEEIGFQEEAGGLTRRIENNSKVLGEKENVQQKFFSQFKALFEERNSLNNQANQMETAILRLEEASRHEEFVMNTFAIDMARVKAENAGLLAEFSQYPGSKIITDKDEEELKSAMSELEKSLNAFGLVNLRALEIYESVEKEFGGLVEKKSVLVKEKDDVVRMMNEIESQKTGLFMSTLNEIDKNFRSIFSAISAKGEAFLELENAEKLFEEGLRMKVRISGSKFLDIRSLSGGEKTLTGLAFLFAIQEHEPASFYVLDEVDAALDKNNSDKLAKLIRKYCEKAQYIVISHHDSLISEADTLYGVSINPDLGISNVISLKM